MDGSGVGGGHRVPDDAVMDRRAGIDVLDAIATTRSIRRFTDEAVPDADLATILFAASRAPTGSNRQPVRFLVLRDGPEARRAREVLAGSARTMWGPKRSGDGYDEGSGARDDSPKARMAAAMDDFVEGFERVPVIVLPCLIRYRQPIPTEGGSVYPGVQNLLLAARALGYGGVLTMFQRGHEDELRRILSIPDGVEIHGTVPLGRPRGGHGPVRRLPLSELVHDGAWERPAPWAVDPGGTRFTSAGPPT